ncbi:MAG TPA: MFS transporter [Dongiaceae bacterium]|nr:MFS transporter [Dongiaceae bacterium]
MALALPSVVASRLRALRHRNFRLFWIGQLISVMGSWMQSVAQAWLMHRLTASAMMLGLLSFTQFLPVTLFSLWAGVLADAMDKRKLVILTQTLMMLQAAALALVVSLGVVQPWMVLVAACVYGVINAFDLPARQSFLVELVGGRIPEGERSASMREDLSNAIALNSAAFNTARVMGPAVAGMLLAWAGEGPCFWINALSFLAVLFALLRMRLPPHPHRGLELPRAARHLVEGIRYAWTTRPLRNLLVMLAFMCGLGFQFSVLLPVYAKDILHSGAQTFGLMVSAFGVGSLGSAVVMTRQLDRWGLRRNLLVGLATAGVGMAAFAWSRLLWLTLAAAFLAGFGLILYVASTNVLLQHTTEDRYRGRIMSLYTFMFIGTAPFGAIAVGAVAQRASAPLATSGSALVLLLGALWMSHRLRVLAARESAAPVEIPQLEGR